MNEPLAYLNGHILPFSSVGISPLDAGFVMGTTVAEQLRTFRGELFHLEDHLARLAESLRVIGVSLDESTDRLASIARELVQHNHASLDPEDDLGLGVLVTPGGYAGYGQPSHPAPTVLLHTYPLQFHLWQERYDGGQSLVIPPTRQVPTDCWPSGLKCRSRMHYYLADREAHARIPGARALLLDHEGHVTEASTANVVVYRAAEGLISPPHGAVLPGISLAQALLLAGQLGENIIERNLTPDDLRTADEVFLTSTPLCLLPVVSLDGTPIATGRPGPLYRRLLQAWNNVAGLDIAAQARRFATR